MSRKLKDLMVEEYTEKFSEIKQRGCVVVGYQGMDATATNNLRRLFDDHDSEMFVIRNRLMAQSLERIGVSELKDCFKGPSAMVLSDDPVQASKAVSTVKEDYAALDIYGGYAEGKLLGAEDIERLADIPDRQVLLGQTLGLISSPARRFVDGINSVMVRFASVLNQVKHKKEEESN